MNSLFFEDVLDKGTYKLEGLKNAVKGSRLKLYVTRDESSIQTTKGPEKRKRHVTDEDVTPEKKWRSDINVEENTESNFLSSDDENPSEPFRSTKDSDSSDPTVVGHYEGKTFVDFMPTGEQWQREKLVIFNVKVKNINDIGKRRKIKSQQNQERLHL